MKSYLSLLTILAVMVVGWLPLCPASAQSVAGTTIITHGFGSDTTGWAYSLALAIQAKSGGKIHATKITASSPLRVEFDAPLYDASRSDALGPNGSGGLILLVDWSDIDTFWDNSALGFSTTDVATALDAKIMATHPQVYRGPIHLIGHSRGGSLIMALAKLLGTRGIWVDHQTTLDRHPTVMGTLTWDFAGSVVGSNVVFADDYFSDGIDRAPQGYPTEGAAKFDLSAFVDGTVSGGSSCSPLFGSVFVRAHTQVHAYYHGTVDAWATCDGDGTPIEPSWYAGLNQPSKAHTGFAYARKMGGTDLSSVPWPGTGTNAAFGSGLLAGSAARDPVALDPNSSPWPNVMAVPQASYSFVAGQAVPIPYIYQRQGTLGMDVVIDLDDDTNPYNAVPQTSPCNRRLATIALSPSSTPQKGTFTWQTNSLDRVPGCYVVLRARTYTSSSPPLIDQERFDYLPSQLTVSASLPTSSITSFTVPPNYPPNQDVSQTLSVPGAQNLAVTINGSLVQGDFLIITDQSGNVIRQLTGSLTQSFNVVGSQIKVQFHGTSFYGGGSTNGVTLSVSATTSPASTFAIGANYGWLSSIGDYSQTLSVPGAQNLAVTINGSLVQGDFLIITDQSGNVIRQLTGSLTQSFNVVGSQIKVQFHGTSFYGGGSTNGVTLSVSATTSPASTFAIGANYGWLSSIGDYSQTLSVPGAQNLAVTINGSLVQGDFLIITDQSGNVIRQLTGSLTQSFNVVGSQIKVQFHGTSFYGGGSTNGVTLSVGAASALAPDTTPDQLSFVSVSSAIPGYSTVSNAVFISGINTPVQATVTAGLMRVNGGPWRNYAYVTLGDRVELLVRNSQLSATTVTAVLQVGGITAPFSVTTLDIEPDAFRFTPQHYVAVNSVRSSDCVTVTGLGSEGATSYVVNGEYQIGCSGSFSASAALLRNGDTVRVRHISSISAGSVVATKFCVGTYCTSFQSTTAGGTFACNLDISGDGLTNGDDAILLLRYLAGFRGDALVAGIRLGSLRPTVVDVTLALSDTTQFDVFGRSPITSASLLLDGLVLSRLLLGFPESTVLAGIAIPQDAANQSTASLRTYINRRCNTAF